ncbi:MAG: hypothetical protein M3O86_02995 [Actinomycetota bacterium]|nr:hypothetical protein [Actinomycetota bacterium]
MTILQVWLGVGVPAIVLALALFYGRSPLRTMLGYVVLLAAFAAITTVDRASGAVIGGVIALLYAAGRGGQAERGATNTSTIAVPDEVRRPARGTPPAP